MSAKEMQIALDTVLFMEEQLTPELTEQHEIFFDPDVTEDGAPYVVVSVSGKDGVDKLFALFGEAVEYQGRNDKAPISVSVIISAHQPRAGMN